MTEIDLGNGMGIVFIQPSLPRLALRVARVRQGAKVPEAPKPGDLGIDLFAAEWTRIPPHKDGVVPTGLAFEFPPTHGAIIKPRGKETFDIGSGVIDVGYRGEILVRVFNHTNNNMVFGPGDSLGQLVLIPAYQIFIEEVLVIDMETERGESGGIWGEG